MGIGRWCGTLGLAAAACGVACGDDDPFVDPFNVEAVEILPAAAETEAMPAEPLNAEEVEADDIAPGELHGSVALPEDPQLRRRLAHAARLTDTGRPEDAATALGRLAEAAADTDAFVRPADAPGSLRSFRVEVQRLIGSLPPDGLDAYRLAFGLAARRMLEDAIAAGGEEGVQRVAALYPHTDAGADALLRLARICRDRGRFAEAAACLARWESLRVGGGGPLETALAADCRSRAAADTVHDVVGNPFLMPRWSQELSQESASVAAVSRSRGPALVPAVRPGVAGGMVLLPTGRGFAAFDLADGARRWTYPAQGSDAGLAATFWDDTARGRVATDGRRAFVIDPATESARPSAPAPVVAFAQGRGRRMAQMFAFGRRGFGNPPAETADRSAATNCLSALEVSEGRQGNLAWRVGGPDGGDEPLLAGHVFLGAPAIDGGRLFAVAEAGREVRLVVLDAATGRLEWSLPLAESETPIESDAARRRAGASPLVVGGVVVCPTGGGGVIAVDRAGRSLLWGYRYPRTGGVADGEGEQPAAPPRTGWTGDAAQVAGDVLILTPPESETLHALDLATGRLLWERPRDAARFAATVGDRVVIVSPRDAVAVAARTGEQAQAFVFPDAATATGLGYADAGGYLLPLSNGTLVRLDLSTAAVAVTGRTGRGETLGNLVWHGGTLLSVGPEFVRAFDDRPRLAESIETALAARPEDAAALLRRADLHTAAGQSAEAIADARRAYAAAGTPHAKNRLVAALLDGLRRGLPDAAAYDAELDRLAGLNGSGR